MLVTDNLVYSTAPSIFCGLNLFDKKHQFYIVYTPKIFKRLWWKFFKYFIKSSKYLSDSIGRKIYLILKNL